MTIGKVGLRDLALEAGLHTVRKIPQFSHERRQIISSYLLELTDSARLLSKNDLAILEALRTEGSITAAAQLLKPGRPGYRAYVQRRFKYFEQLATKIYEKLTCLIQSDPESDGLPRT
jgi:hypothetical protein